MSKTKLSLAVFSAIIGISPMVATAEETKGEGFVEGSSLNILNRNFYMNRDFRDGQSSSTGNGYSEAWAHGVMVNFESGFTEGTVGVGTNRSTASRAKRAGTRHQLHAPSPGQWRSTALAVF